MQATAVSIANAALTACGHESILVQIDDPCKEGRLCTQNYDLARRAVLAKQPWKFAILRVQLDLASDQTPVFGWASAFPVPEDYIRAVTVNDRWQEFVREGRYILCDDVGPINLRYVRDEEAVEKFDPLFFDAVALDLAVRICYSLTQSNDAVQRVTQMMQDNIRKARFTDAIEQSMQLGVEADLYDEARMGGGRQARRFDPGT